MNVSNLAAAVGLRADTIRYYERLGLLPPQLAVRPAIGNTARRRAEWLKRELARLRTRLSDG